jgi:hypothetical protein
MATCPRCLGPLTEHHQCPRGMFSRIADALFTAGIGCVLGAVFAFAVDEHPAGALILAAAALGAVLASAVRQAIVGVRN